MDDCNKMCQELRKYQSDLPYPPVQVVGKNQRYASILHNDYAGRAGEITAILQYSYQSFAQEAINSEIADIMHYISIVEMHHLEMLGELIFKLGGDATYTSFVRGHPVFWNASMVYYGRNVNNMLTRNIQDEKTAIANYRRSISMIGDQNINNVLKRIILDEEHHIKIFEQLLNRMGG